MLFGRRKARASVRTAAWHAQVCLALYAPFSMTANTGDQTWHPDTVVGASVEHSEHVGELLESLVLDLASDNDLTALALQAAQPTIGLAHLRPNWVAYCDQRALPQDDDQWRAMAREWPSPETVNQWPHCERARSLTQDLTQRLAELHTALVAACGSDITATPRARMGATAA
ncbi:hypothetical protein [Streptomyces bluensis]|uniref:hypothetical protein n=1 Tax=Streptomyces bluensis TaxID=33897 RepID=UPI00331CDBC6